MSKRLIWIAPSLCMKRHMDFREHSKWIKPLACGECLDFLKFALKLMISKDPYLHWKASKLYSPYTLMTKCMYIYSQCIYICIHLFIHTYIYIYLYAVRCGFYAVNFHPKFHNRHPMCHTGGREKYSLKSHLILFDKCRKVLQLDTNKQNQSWNFYQYPPGFIRGNQIIRLQSAEGGRCNDQFARSIKIVEARQTHNRTDSRFQDSKDSRFKIALLLPIRHSIQYSHISTNYKYQ